MFKDSKSFEDALLLVLKAIHNNGEVDNFGVWQNELTDLQFNDVLEYALNARLLTGLKPKLGADESLSISVSSPRLTYEGLKLIEQQ